MALVSECVIVQRAERLYALVHPDYDEAKSMGFSEDEIEGVMEQNRNALNQSLPAYCKISAIEIHHEEFAKTPKKSIKRYLYQ